MSDSQFWQVVLSTRVGEKRVFNNRNRAVSFAAAAIVDTGIIPDMHHIGNGKVVYSNQTDANLSATLEPLSFRRVGCKGGHAIPFD